MLPNYFSREFYDIERTKVKLHRTYFHVHTPPHAVHTHAPLRARTLNEQQTKQFENKKKSRVEEKNSLARFGSFFHSDCLCVHYRVCMYWCASFWMGVCFFRSAAASAESNKNFPNALLLSNIFFFAKRRPHFFLPSSHSHTKFLFRRLSRASNVHQHTDILNCNNCRVCSICTQSTMNQRKYWRRLALNINTDAYASTKEKIDTRSKEYVIRLFGIGYFYALDASCT